jgi:hypothetical protein
MQDWKGNPILHGHEFCIVRISTSYRLKFNGMVYLHNPFQSNSIVPSTIQYWEPGPYYIVRDGFFKVEGEYTYRIICTDIFDLNLYKDDRYIIALKGVSDKKEEYYGTK